MDLKEMEEKLGSMARELAKDWFLKQCRNLYSSYYLYFSRSSNKEDWGEVKILEDSETMELASPERFSPAYTQDTIRHQIRAMLQTLPILPVQ